MELNNFISEHQSATSEADDDESKMLALRSHCRCGGHQSMGNRHVKTSRHQAWKKRIDEGEKEPIYIYEPGR